MFAGVPTWWRVAFVALLAWMLAVGVWANRSWTDNVPLQTPPDVAAQERAFVCGPPLGAKSAEPENAAPGEYPPLREPCELHGQRRAIAVIDIGLGVAGIALLIYVGRRRSSRKEARVTPVTG